jgi:hypothetical protein
MRKTFLILLSAILLITALQAQVPQKVSYQSVIRDATDHLVTTQVGMQISILQATSTGTAVYVETQTPTPNSNGLVTIEIGGGTPVSTGTFAAIDWSAGPYFIKTETDPSGGTGYSLTDIKQFISVPYTLYAKERGGHFIGEFYGSGIVVAVSRAADGEHGLIASLTNLGPAPGSPWSEDQITFIGPAAQSLTDGQSNTNAILAKSPSFESAAKLCDDYRGGGFDDWYLPSIRELKECYDSKFAVTHILGNIDGFLFDNYWSSTENMDDNTGATTYFIGFHIGILNPGGHKTHLLRVRAVRRF